MSAFSRCMYPADGYRQAQSSKFKVIVL